MDIDNRNASVRRRLEACAREKYGVEAERLPFNRGNYAILRHADSGKWFAVFIAKPRAELGLPGDGDGEIVSLKARDGLLADLLAHQPGTLRGYPSAAWNWISVPLDGTTPFEEICRLMDMSHEATRAGGRKEKAPRPGRSNERRGRVH